MKRMLLGCMMLLASAGLAKADCKASATHVWQASKVLRFTIEAVTTGKSCDTAVALLIVRNDKDVPLYTFVAPTENVAMLAKDHRTGGQTMQQAVTEWISLESNFRKPDFLMPWPKGSDSPPVKEGEEFAFMVSDQISRDTYEAGRSSGNTLYCFVQGIESEACLSAADSETVTQIGYQPFPG